MTWFDRFISFCCLAFVAVVGTVAIHSLRVETLPIDYALGLIGSPDNKIPAFTLSARAQQSVYVVNPSTPILKQIDLQRQLFSKQAAAILKFVRNTIQNVRRVLDKAMQVLNTAIESLRNTGGKDVSIFNMISSVNQLSLSTIEFKRTYQESFQNIQNDQKTLDSELNDSQKQYNQNYSKLVLAYASNNAGLTPTSKEELDIQKDALFKFDKATNVQPEEIGTTTSSVPYTAPLDNLFSSNCAGSDCARNYEDLGRNQTFENDVSQAEKLYKQKEQEVEKGQGSNGCGYYLNTYGKKTDANGQTSFVVPTIDLTVDKVSDTYKNEAIPLKLCQALDRNNQNKADPASAEAQNGQTGDTSSAIDLVVNLYSIAMEIKGLLEEIMQTVYSMVGQIQSSFSEFSGLRQSLGLVSVNDDSSSALFTAFNEAVKGVSDNKYSIDTTSFLADQNNFKNYSNQSGDCILDSVKNESAALSSVYISAADGSNSTTISPDKILNTSEDNFGTYKSGSNVPDGVLGTTITDQKTPPISGLTYKSSDASGQIPATPAKSVISLTKSSLSPNGSYHTCQLSLWQDDNSVETAAARSAFYNPTFGVHSAYRDGVSTDYRVVNKIMNKTIPDQCYLTNNNLSDEEKRSIISGLDIAIITNVGSNGFEAAWQDAKAKVDEAQRQGNARWDSDTDLTYESRVRSGVTVVLGTNNDGTKKKKEVQIKQGACEVNLDKDKVNASLKEMGWNFTKPAEKSFSDLILK